MGDSDSATVRSWRRVPVTTISSIVWLVACSCAYAVPETAIVPVAHRITAANVGPPIAITNLLYMFFNSALVTLSIDSV